MKVSIAVLSYNHEKYVKQSIESILNQKVNFNYEIVIGEDCSTDGTREILKKYQNLYPEKIKLIIREENIGPIPNYLDVMSKCRGEYIAFLETDDYWTDNKKLQDQLSFLEKNKEYSGIYYRVKKINEKNEIIGYLPEKDIAEEELNYYDYKDVIYKKIYSIPSFGLMFRNFYKGEINATIKKYYSYSKWLGDYPTSIIISNIGKIKFESRICGCYRYITEGGTSYSSQGSVKLEDYLKFLNGIEKIYEFEFSNEKNYIEKFAKHEIVYLRMLFKEKKYQKICNYIFQSKKYSLFIYFKIILRSFLKK